MDHQKNSGAENVGAFVINAQNAACNIIHRDVVLKPEMKRCAKCHRFMRKGKRFCLICIRKINKLKSKAKPKPEIYLGKKEECASCGVIDYLFSTKKFSRKVCKNCKNWLEVKLSHLPNLALK